MKKEEPFISIIIPTFNAEKLLSRALESLNAQSYKNFEVVIIDGMSNDDTIKIAKSFENKFSSLRIYTEKDQGIYDAMNKGISYAKGDWLYFLGSDDYLYGDEVLEKVVNQVMNSNSEIIYGNVHSNFYNGSYDGEFSFEKLTRLNICHQAIFFHKKVFKQIGKFDLKYKVAADWDYNIKWFFNSRIKRNYADLIIAEFSDGGYSNLNEDILFEQHRNFKLIKKGFFKLPIHTLKKLCKMEKNKLSEKDGIIKKTAVLSWFYLMKIRFKIEHLTNRNNLL